ncbi:MAG: glycosyltransferase [Smithellaceae bacterium]|nr:glycosyltransferase [Smithellaceae bacterium]
MSSKRPRVLVLTSTFPRWENDTEPAFVFELSRRLAREFDVTVLSPRTPGSKERENTGGLKVIRFPYFFGRWEKLAMSGGGILNKLKSHPLYYLLVPFFLLGQLLAVVRLLRNQRFDLIHAHWLIPQGFIAALSLSITGKKIPLLCTSHGGDLFALKGKGLQRLKRWVMDKSAALTVVSHAMKKTVVDMGVEPDKVEVIPMGVDLKGLFTPDSGAQRKTDELLFVGRLVEKKGVHFLLEAMPTVLKKHPTVRLILAGSGPMEEELRQQAQRLHLSDRVTFSGMVSQAKLPELYRAATLAIFPFVVAKSGDQEGFGLVQVEAMGCECPVITGDLPAIHDIVIHEKTGLIVESGNTQALADAIIRMLDDPGFRESLANEGRIRVAEMFDWYIVAQGYANVYKRLTKR